jgi:multimeric flavodoxin WrbA
MTLKALAINATLKRGTDPSSTDAMIETLGRAFAGHDVEIVETIRLANFNILPGVLSDEGEGDDWPGIRQKVIEADILIFGTPIWMGQMSSIAKRVLERFDAFLDETDDQGRMPSYSKVAVAAIVGNEDGAHAVSANLFQALNDVGFTIPAVAACYWVGEAMGSTDYQDLRTPRPMVEKTAKMVASNAAHLVGLLKRTPYPG